MRMIPTKIHGVLDYLTSAGLLVLPRALGWDPGVTRAVSGMALGTIGYSALTRYELGLIKLLPMPAHLALDALNAALFCGGPWLFANRDRDVRRALLAIGLFELTVTLLSDPRPPQLVHSDRGSLGGWVNDERPTASSGSSHALRHHRSNPL